MNLNLFSFFLNSERSFIEFNTNILETNIINIFLLFGLLFYANKVSLSGTLEERQKEIIQTIENAQKDVLNASNYYSLAEKGIII
jgi:F0F1-type ATP synthase membrane subunit b/b'